MSRLAKLLKHRVAIQQATQTQADDGSFVLAYTTTGTAWAGLKAVSATQYLAGVQKAEGVTHEFLFRTGAEMTTDDFLLLLEGDGPAGRRFRVRRFLPDEEHREFIKVLAEELAKEDGQ